VRRDPETRPVPRWRRLLKPLGFVLGLGLFAWCVSEADLAAAGRATPAEIVALVACTLLSVVANGSIFWLVVRPLARVPWLDVQIVNGVVNLLNYAPVRLGLVTRIAHHRRVDGLGYGTMAAWYAGVAAVLMLVLAVFLGATLLRPQTDLAWFVLLGIGLVGGGAALAVAGRLLAGTGRLRGAERVVSHPGVVAGSILLRLLDMAAAALRLHLAFGVLDIELSVRDVVYLVLVAMLTNLSPAGSLGFREFALTRLGEHLTDPQLVESLAAAALVDRAAEAIVFIPMGALGLAWMGWRWSRPDVRGAGPGEAETDDEKPREDRAGLAFDLVDRQE